MRRSRIVLVGFPLVAALLAPARPADAGSCAGDCNADGRVSIEELILAVDIALGSAELDSCFAIDSDGDGNVSVAELVTAVGWALGGCAPDFWTKLATLRWIAYAPTGFDPNLGCPAGYPDEQSIRADLAVLRSYGFDGLVTFAADCTLGEVPRLAVEEGFRGVVMGLFLFDASSLLEEVVRAKAAAPYVDAYGAGNEGLVGCGGSLYDADTLSGVIDELRDDTGKPVTTSEQIEDYLDGGCLDGFLLGAGDWLFPIVHPFNNEIRDPEAGAAFTEERYRRLESETAKPVFFKETGWPTAGDAAATEENQQAYFRLLDGRDVRFAHFEAFDQPFKQAFPTPWEPFWGLFRPDRAPKRFVVGGRSLSSSATSVLAGPS